MSKFAEIYLGDKMRIILYIILLTVIINLSNAQNYEFRVMASSGTVEYNENTKQSKDWKMVKVGLALTKNSILRLKEGYVSLIHKSGSTIELTSPKIYSSSEIKKKLNKNIPDIKKKIAKFIFQKLADQFATEDSRREENPVGGVERDVIIPMDNRSFMALYPKNSKIIDDVVAFAWTSGGFGEFVFSIRDKFDKLIHTENVKDTIHNVNLKSLALKPGNCYYWDVKTGVNATKQYCILPLYDKEIREIKQDESSLIKVSNIGSPVDNVILGTFYAEKKIAYRAAEHYLRAKKLAPDVPEYNALYNLYISVRSEE
jgi:hypothetical protein